MILRIRRRITQTLEFWANILMLDHKMARFLMYLAQKVSPDPASPPNFITKRPSRWDR